MRLNGSFFNFKMSQKIENAQKHFISKAYILIKYAYNFFE